MQMRWWRRKEKLPQSCWKRAWRLEMVETRVSTPRYRLRTPGPAARSRRVAPNPHCVYGALVPVPLVLFDPPIMFPGP